MRRRLRWLWLTALCLVVLAWSASGMCTYGVASSGTNESTQLLSSRGCLVVLRISFPGIAPRGWHATAELNRGVGWTWSSWHDRGLHADSAGFPMWWGAAPLGLLTALAWWRRRTPGRCMTCGYETRELPVCPECGTPTSVRTSAAPRR